MNTHALPRRRGLSRWVRTPYEYLVLYGGLAAFGASGLAFSTAARLVDPFLPRRVAGPLGRAGIGHVFRGYTGLLLASGIVRLDLSALDALRDEKPMVIAPNHPSLLDAVLVLSRVPNAVVVMKPSILDNPVLAGGASLAGYIPADAPLRTVHAAVGAIRAGAHVLVFPEGTRTVQRPINRLTASFALIARLAGCPVQTVLVETNSRYLGKGGSLLRKPEFPLEYRVRLGRRFEPAKDTAAFVREVESCFRHALDPESSVKATDARHAAR